MSKLSIKRHNDNATEITIGDRGWFFSYNTCVAFYQDFYDVSTPSVRIRRESNYSPTTAKHMNYMGVKDWPKVDDATFERIAVS